MATSGLPQFTQPVKYRNTFTRVPYVPYGQETEQPTSDSLSIWGGQTQQRTSIFDDIFKPSPIDSTLASDTAKQSGVWEALKYSAYKGFVDYAADTVDVILSKLQEAKLGTQASIERITKTSSDSDRQALFDKYNQDVANANTREERQAARRNLDAELQKAATERQYGVAAGESKYADQTPRLTQARKNVSAYFEPKIQNLTKLADVENEGWFTQVVASAAESTPYTLMSRLNVAGFFLNYGVQEQRAIQQKAMELQAQGKTITLDDKQNILMNAVGSAVIEAGSEMIFPAGSGALSKATIKQLAKFVVVQGIQEGAEEIISAIGQGFLAKLTTDKDATLFGIAESSGALINLQGLGKAYLAGAVMGTVYSGAGGTIGLVKTKSAANKVANKKLDEVTQEDLQEVETAVREDAKDPDNVDELFGVLSNQSYTMAQSMPADKQAQNLESAVASLQEKSANQVLQPEEKAQTDALIQQAESELKQVYQQAQEEAVQAPTSPVAEQVVQEPIQTPANATEVATQPSATIQEQTVSSFKTSQGSTYVVDGETTQRTKTLHKGHLPTDVGQKQKSVKTVYVSSDMAKEIGMWQTLSSPVLAVQLVDGKIVLLSGTNENLGIDRASGNIDQSYSETPEVGKYPLELFSETTKQGVSVYQGTHPGNEIVEITQTQAKPAQEEKPKEKAKSMAAEASRGAETVISAQELQRMVKEGIPEEDLQFAANELSQSDALAPFREKLSTDGALDADKIADAVIQTTDSIKRIALAKADSSSQYVKMLVLNSLANMLADKRKGENLTRYMAHITEALQAGQPDEVVQKINEGIKHSDLFHKILTNKETMETADRKMANAAKKKGGIVAYYEKVAEKIYSWNGKAQTVPQLTTDELYTLSKYAQYLIQQDNTSKAMELTRKLSKVLTAYGRVNQAAILLKYVFPEHKAERVINDLENAVDLPQGQKDKIDDLSKTAQRILGRERKKAINETIIDVFTPEPVKGETKEPAKKMTLAERFASMVELYATKPETEADQKTVDLEKRLLDTLFAKAKEAMTDPMQQRVKKTAIDKAMEKFAVIAEVITNRKLFAEVWNDAQTIVEKDQLKLANSKLYDFLETLADPVASNKLLDEVVSANIVTTGKNVTQAAKEYFLLGGESIDRFLQQLRNNMPNIDDASFDYLKDHVAMAFLYKMEARRQTLQIAFRESYKEKLSRKQYRNMQEVMIKQLTDAAFYDSLSIPEISEQFAKLMGLPYITEAMRKDIYDTMRRVAKLTDSIAVDNEVDAMQRRIAGSIPPSFDEKVKALARTAMLLNPVSWLRNTASNLLTSPYYKSQDRLVNRMMKRWGSAESQIAGDKQIEVDANSYIGKTVLSHSTNAHLERVRNKTAKYTWQQLFSFEKKYFPNHPWLQKAIELPNEVMNVGAISRKNKAPLNVKILSDAYMFEKYYRISLANKLNAQGFNESMSEEQRTKILEQAMEYAGEIATLRTFRMSTVLSNLIKSANRAVMHYELQRDLRLQKRFAEADKIRADGKKWQIGIFMATPFVVTPAALIQQGYRFSPLSLVVGLAQKQYYKKKGTLNVDGRDLAIANKIAQGAIGTAGQFLVGALLGGLGFLDAAPPDNEKEKQAWALAGRRAYSIRTPWGSLSLDWLQPISSGVFAGAAFADALDGWISKDYSIVEGMGRVSTAMIDSLFQNTMLDNVRTKFSSYDGKFSTILSSNVQDSLFMFMPNLLRRASNVIDPYTRDVYSGNALQVTAKRIAQYFPFASLALPPKIDIWGQPVKKTSLPEPAGFLDRVIFQFSSPFLKTEAYLDPVSKEVLSVFEATQKDLGNVALPGVLQKLDDMSSSEWIEYQKTAGQLSKQGIEKLMTKGSYQNMTDLQKAKALEKVYAKAREKARKEYDKRKQG